MFGFNLKWGLSVENEQQSSNKLDELTSLQTAEYRKEPKQLKKKASHQQE